LKDSSKPDGEACNEDGTLKDAEEMEWPNSPTDLATTTIQMHTGEVDSNEEDGSEDDGNDGMRGQRFKRRRAYSNESEDNSDMA
jgi:hypothetical protein